MAKFLELTIDELETKIVVGGERRPVRNYDANTGRPLAPTNGQQSLLSSMLGGARVASTVTHNRETLRLLDYQGIAAMSPIECHDCIYEGMLARRADLIDKAENADIAVDIASVDGALESYYRANPSKRPVVQTDFDAWVVATLARLNTTVLPSAFTDRDANVKRVTNHRRPLSDATYAAKSLAQVQAAAKAKEVRQVAADYKNGVVTIVRQATAPVSIVDASVALAAQKGHESDEFAAIVAASQHVAVGKGKSKNGIS